MDIAELGFRVDTKGILDADKALIKLDESGKRVETTGKQSGSALSKSMRESSAGIGTATGALAGLATKLGGIAAVAGGGLGLKSLITTARDFQASMNDVQEKLNLSGTAMQEVRDFALDMGSKTAFSASQAADAMSNLAALGMDATESMQTLPDVLNLASGASMSLDEAASVTAKTLNQFGLDIGEATRVVDLLAGSADSSAADVDYLAEVFSKVGPTATQLGVSMEEVAAAAGVMADNGVRAETTGTALRNMFDQLLNPSDAVAEALGKVGLASEDFVKYGADGARQFVGLGEAFDLLKNSGADVPDLMNILGREISSLTPAVLKGSDGLQQMAASADEAASAAEQAATKTQGLPGAFTSLASAFEGFQLSLLGTTGSDAAEAAIRGLADILRSSIGVLDDAHEAFGEFKDRLDGVGSIANAQAGPAMEGIYGVINRIRSVIGPVIPYLDDFGIAAAAIAGSALGISFLASALAAVGAVVLSPVVLAVGGLAAAAVTLRANWDGISAWWSGLWTGLDGNVSQFVDRLVTSIRGMVADFGSAAVSITAEFGTKLTDGVGKAFDAIPWPSVPEILGSAGQVVVAFGQLAVTTAAALINGLAQQLSGLLASIKLPTKEQVAASASAFVDGFVAIAQNAVDGLRASLAANVWTVTNGIDWPGVQQLLSSAASMIAAFGDLALTAMRVLGVGLYNGVRNILSEIDWPTPAEIGQTAAQMVLGFGELAMSAIDALKNTFSTEMGGSLNEIDWPTPTEIVSAAADLVTGFAEAAGEAIGAFIAALSDGLGPKMKDIDWPSRSDIIDSASALFNWFGELGIELVKELGNGMLGVGQALVDGIRAGLGGAGAAILNVLADTLEKIPFGSYAADKFREMALEGTTGLGLGFDQGAPAAGDAAAALGTHVLRSFDDAVGRQSPWRTMIQRGLEAGAGLVIGLAQGAGNAIAAAGRLAGSILDEFDQAASRAAESGTKMGADFTTSVADGVDEEIPRVRNAADTLGQELARGIEQSITAADSVRDAFRNLGDWLKNWLKEKIAHFAANRIVAYVGQATGIDFGTVGSAIGALGRGGAGSAAAASAAGGATAAEIAAGAGAYGGGSAATAAGTGAAGGGALAGLGSTVGIAAAWIAGIKYIGDTFGRRYLDSRREENRDLVRENIDYVTSTVDGIGRTVEASFNALGSTYVASSQQMVQTVIDYQSGRKDFSFAESLERSLGVATREAYVAAFEGLGPDMRELIGDSIDIENTPIPELAELFDGLTQTVTQLAPVLTFASDRFAETTDAVAADIIGLAENLGGLDAAIQAVGFVVDNFFSAEERTAAMASQTEQAVVQARESWAELTSTLGMGQLATINTREDFTRIWQVLANDVTPAGQQAFASLTQLAPAFDAAFDAADALAEQQRANAAALMAAYDGVSTAAANLNLNFDRFSPLALEASGALVELFGGLEGFTAAAGNYYDKFFTEEEKKNIVMAQSAGEVAAFNEVLGLTGGAAIDTRDEFRAYVEGLNLQTVAGRAAYEQAMAVTDSMYAVSEAGGDTVGILNGLPAEVTGAFELARQNGVDTFNGMAVDIGAIGNEMSLTLAQALAQLPEETRAQMDAAVDQFDNAMIMLARLAGTRGVEAVDGLDTGLAGLLTVASETGIGASQELSAGLSAMAELARAEGSGASLALATALEQLAGITQESGEAAEQALADGLATMPVSAGTISAETYARFTEGVSAMPGYMQDMFARMDETTGVAITQLDNAFRGIVGLGEQLGIDLQGTLQTRFSQIVLNSGLTGDALVRELDAAFTAVLADAGIVRATLPPTIGAGFDAMIRDAASAATSISGSASTIATGAQSVVNPANSAGSALSGVGTQASGIVGPLNSAGNAFAGAASAIRSAAIDAASAAGQARQVLQNAARLEQEQRDAAQGLATGLDYVPRDGMRASLHRGEMVVTAKLAEQLRAMGFSGESGSPGFRGGSRLGVSSLRSGGDGGAAVASELRAVRDELSKLRREQSQQAARADTGRSTIVGESAQQTSELRRLQREQQQLARRIAKLAAA